MNKIIRNGDNTYTYNYNLHIVEGQDGPYETSTPFTLYGYPSQKECIRAVIRHHISVDEEFDLINSYNRPDRTDIDVQKYVEYLSLVDEIKSNVKADFENETIVY